MSRYERNRIKAASARGKRMAAARWAKDRERREILARLNPINLGRIVRRVVVIDNESSAREAIIYAFDSRRSAGAKLRAVLAAP